MNIGDVELPIMNIWSDKQLSEMIIACQREQRRREREKDIAAVEEFKTAARKFFERNIGCYITFHDEAIYISDVDELNFEL